LLPLAHCPLREGGFTRRQTLTSEATTKSIRGVESGEKRRKQKEMNEPTSLPAAATYFTDPPHNGSVGLLTAVVTRP